MAVTKGPSARASSTKVASKAKVAAAARKPSVQISGIGTHQIDLKLVDKATRARVMECIEKNGRISVVIGGGGLANTPDGGFAQKID